MFSKRFRRGLYDFSRNCTRKTQIKHPRKGIRRIIPSLKHIGTGRNKGLEAIRKLSLCNCYHTEIAAKRLELQQSNHDASSSDQHKFMSEEYAIHKTMFELKRSTRYPDLDKSELAPPTTPNILMAHKRTCYKTQQYSEKTRKIGNSMTLGSSHKIKMEQQPNKYRVVFASQHAHSEPLCIPHLQIQGGVIEDRVGLQQPEISSDSLMNNHTY